MKKVFFKKWIPRKTEKKTQFSYETVIPGTGCYEEEFTQEGEFLTWGIDYVDDGSGATYTVALVIVEDGTVVKVPTENIKFEVNVKKPTVIKIVDIREPKSQIKHTFDFYKTDEEIVEFIEDNYTNTLNWTRL